MQQNQHVKLINLVDTDKVNRFLARYSPRATTTNHPPTGHRRSLHGLAQIDKNANFGPNLFVFGQKIIFFTGELKSFVTHMTENPPRHWALEKMRKKWQYLVKVLVLT